MNKRTNLPYKALKLTPFIKLSLLNKSIYNPLQRNKCSNPYLYTGNYNTIKTLDAGINRGLRPIKNKYSSRSVKGFLCTSTSHNNYAPYKNLEKHKVTSHKIYGASKEDEKKYNELYWIVRMSKERYNNVLKPSSFFKRLNLRANEAPKRSNVIVKKLLNRLLQKSTKGPISPSINKDEAFNNQVPNIEEEKNVIQPIIEVERMEVNQRNDNANVEEVQRDNISDRSTIVEHYNQEVAIQNLEHISTEEEI